LPVFALDESLNFPPTSLAEPDGLLAFGGDLSVERLLAAYRKGIFPWYQGEDILWWSPDPRFVLFPKEIKTSQSMKKLLKKNVFNFQLNHDFKQVIHHCKKSFRAGQDGTWITDEMESAYIKMHELGYAISAEAWQENKLVGGLYGILLGKVFFGESMFSLLPNTSKFALIHLADFLIQKNIEVIDCQVYTEHLESLGARMVGRKEFEGILNFEF
jgi:leucyl/phenylalanyl-tRNA--protein transferase